MYSKNADQTDQWRNLDFSFLTTKINQHTVQNEAFFQQFQPSFKSNVPRELNCIYLPYLPNIFLYSNKTLKF